jgi:multidrug efflux system membrane fusion protein
VDADHDTPTHSRSRGGVLFAILLVAAAGAGYWRFQQQADAPRSQTQAQPRAPAPVPVTVAIVAKQDLPVIVTGLGAVQASATVKIFPQVDGKLQDVSFIEGQRVRKGDVLARLDPRLYKAALDQARARKAQDEAQLIGAQKDLDRARALAQKDFGSRQNLDQQQAKVDQFKAALAADDAAISTAQTQLDYTTIIAPMDGRIGIRAVDPGNLVRAAESSAIATLTQTRPIAAILTLSARYLDDLRAAMASGPVEVVAYDQDNRRVLSRGKLLLIDSAIDQATATMRLKAMFDNEDDRLWPGQFINGRILVETRRDALPVATSAIQRGPQGLFVWVVDEKNIVSPRPVTTGPVSGDLTIIVSGLEAGEKVVTDGHYKLQVGAPVTYAAGAQATARGGP